MHEIVSKKFEKIDWNIHHYEITLYWEKINERIFNILEFQEEWWESMANIINRILDREPILIDNILL